MTPEHQALQHHINQQYYVSGSKSGMLEMAQSQLNQSMEDHRNGNYQRAHKGLEAASKFLQTHMADMANSHGHDNILDQVDVDIQPNSYKYAYLS